METIYTEIDSQPVVIETSDEESSFGVELAKTFALSAAAVAGSLAGLALLSVTADKLADIKIARAEKRKAKKEAKENTEKSED